MTNPLSHGNAIKAYIIFSIFVIKRLRKKRKGHICACGRKKLAFDKPLINSSGHPHPTVMSAAPCVTEIPELGERNSRDENNPIKNTAVHTLYKQEQCINNY